MKNIIIVVFLLLTIGRYVYAAGATPVAISAISRSANIVTVTCATSCGITTNQGFSVTGVADPSFNLNGTALTGSGTSFTFNQPGANASSSGGQVLPAKEIIVVGVVIWPHYIDVHAICWVTTTTPTPTPTASRWEGATAAENNAILSGTTIEEEIPTSAFTTGTTIAIIQADLFSKCSAVQSTFKTGQPPQQFHGGFYDGVGWSF